MIKVLHIITGLQADGAETMLKRLVCRMDRSRFVNEVISLTTVGEVGRSLMAEGIHVEALGMRKGIHSVRSIRRITSLIQDSKPAVVQTWMYHADLAGGIAARTVAKTPVVWGIHHASPGFRNNKPSTVAVAKACALLSRRVPERIVCCSQTSQRDHAAFGYDQHKTTVIPNGFDTDEFKPDEDARIGVRQELGLAPSAFLVAVVARFHPHKDYGNLFSAIASFHRQHPDVHFLLCGKAVDWDNREVVLAVRETEMASRIHLLGHRRDVARILASADVMASPSRTEAFPLAVGEAMASEVPCAVTDVGDSAFLVGDTGIVVPARNPEALARAWHLLYALCTERRRDLGRAARLRIQQEFSIAAATRRYEELYTLISSN